MRPRAHEQDMPATGLVREKNLPRSKGRKRQHTEKVNMSNSSVRHLNTSPQTSVTDVRRVTHSERFHQLD